jgi:hypothetical protein
MCTALLVVTRVNTFAGLREGSEKVLRCEAGSRKAHAHLLAETLKAPLLREEYEAIPQTQNSKGRSITQPQILTELLRHRQLAFFADLGRRQIFESGIVACHRR